MATAELKPRDKMTVPKRPERENDHKEARDGRNDHIAGVITLLLMLALFVLAIALASIDGEPTELDPVDYWMMP